jgi:hypothetical protein
MPSQEEAEIKRLEDMRFKTNDSAIQHVIDLWIAELKERLSAQLSPKKRRMSA